MWEPGAGWKLLIQSADIWHLSLCVWVERHSKCAKRGWNNRGFTGSQFMPCIGQMKGCLSGFHCCCPSSIRCRYWDFHICLRHAWGTWEGGFSKLHWPSGLSFGSAEPTPSSCLCADINYDRIKTVDACVTLYKISIFDHKHRCIFQHFIHLCEHMHKCITEGFFFFSKISTTVSAWKVRGDD